MPNDKSPPEPETAAQQETGGDCVSRLVVPLLSGQTWQTPGDWNWIVTVEEVVEGVVRYSWIEQGGTIHDFMPAEEFTERFDFLHNAGGMARELAAQDSDNTTDLNG